MHAYSKILVSNKTAYIILCTRQDELGNEAKLVMLNNKPIVVATDLGCTTLVSLSGPGCY